MKEILKRDWPYAILIVVLVVLSVLSVGLLRFGFFTAYDEAYFLLKLQEAYDMSCITGKSQWNLIAIHWFPYLDLTSKVNSFLASNILSWFTILVMTITCCAIYDKGRALRYFALIFLFYFAVETDGLSYISMQMAVLCWALCSFMLFQHCQKKWEKCLFAGLCGFCLGLSCFIIIPAAILVLASIAFLIMVLYWKQKREMFLFLGSGIVGMFLTMAYMHFCVCDLGQIINAMSFAANYITKSGYGYDGMSFFVQYGLFFKDCLFALLAFVGSYYLSKLFKSNYFGTVAYVLILVVYSHFQKEPVVTNAMLLSSVAIIPLLCSDSASFSGKTLLLPKTWVYLFLLVFPLLASFGTNTSIGVRISCFVVSWLFIWFDIEQENSMQDKSRVMIGAAILYLIPLASVVRDYQNRDDSFHFTRGNKYFAEIALTEKQADYFNRVYDILEDYNYQPKQSTILTACYDYCCLYAFDAVNAANYHQSQNFRFFPKEKMIEPDFIFICKLDSIVMGKDLLEMPWGWPEDYDEYYVGTPEPDDAPWLIYPKLEKRKLYCRKSLKIKK
jgi:hypothetical protein